MPEAACPDRLHLSLPGIPPSAAGLDADWLTRAFALDRPGTVVRAVAHDRIIPGASTKVRLRLDYAANPHDLPARMWAKAGWESHSASHRAMGIYVKEAQFYRDWAQVTRITAPACYFAMWQDDGDAIMLLGDIPERGGTLWDPCMPRSAEDVAALLDSLASLHAMRWRDPTLSRNGHLGLPMRSTGPLSAWPRANGGERIREAMAGPRGEGLPDAVRDGARIEAAFWKMVDALEASTPTCLLHADPHPGNCYSAANGDAGLFDWQTLSCGTWAYDVGYAVAAALDPDTRRHTERDLLAAYLDRLHALGCADLPDFAAAWDEYRRHVAYPLLIWATNHVSHQPETIIRALTYRLGMAAADFGLFALWGV